LDNQTQFLMINRL